LQLADKRERAWRQKAKSIYELYTPDDPVKNSFGILFSNTETLRQACYNSLPQPQCRRRYSDEDPVGGRASEVLTRSLEFTTECTDFDAICQQLVLSMLLAGRAVGWERYQPRITQGDEGYEQIEWEECITEKVQYDDFRILCAARTWSEVTAIGRRHRLTRQECIDQFGEDVGNKIKLDNADNEDVNKSEDSDLFKTAEVWEIWDKDAKSVVFISQGLPVPCKVEPDPLSLEDFFPTPRPLYAIENDNTLVPACLYTQYEQQAAELNRISKRINILVDALRFRGVYDATLTEMSQLMKSGDNGLIASQNVQAILDRGGLEKAIWMMPINVAAAVIKELYVQRDATKQVIYEITGISDIMRSATDANETLGAQKIKTQWGTQRLQRMQKEVQRYIRDQIRLKAEIIAKKFQPETLEAMTLVKLPHQADLDKQKQLAMAQYQQAAMQAQMQGQQPPPPPPMPAPQVTWEAVLQQLQSDTARAYHIDIETDSTLASTQDTDMAGLRETIAGIIELVQGLAPAVQAGAMPIDTVKALIGVVVRRAKMGTEVEDAIGKILQPQPQQNPEAIKAQAEQQKQQMIMQQKQQEAQMKMQHESQLEQIKAQAAMAKEKAQAEGDAAKEQYRMQADMQIEQNRAQMHIATEEAKLRSNYAVNEAERNFAMQTSLLEQQKEREAEERKLEFERWKTEYEAATKISIAKLQAKVTLASKDGYEGGELKTDLEEEHETKVKEDHFKLLTDMHGKTLEAINTMASHISKPKRIVRDANGKAQGLE
jgi:hypothetical protein